MDEREYSHRLGKRKTGYLYKLTRAANADDDNRLQGDSSSIDVKDRLYDDLSLLDTGLTEMWMEMRM